MVYIKAAHAHKQGQGHVTEEIKLIFKFKAFGSNCLYDSETWGEKLGGL